MTNSPPGNVNHGLGPNEAGRPLVSGIDSLSLAFDLSWLSSETFDRLEALKEKSKDQDTAVFQVEGGDVVWEFVVKPHGSNGYAWLIQNREMSMKIGAWTEPRQRPSAMVDVRSEALWTHGPAVAVNRVVRTLAGMGAVGGAVLGAPISTTLIVFELTGDWQTGLAVMVAVSIASALASRMVDRSFFLTQLERRGIHLAAGPQAYLLAMFKVSSVMKSSDHPNAPPEDRVRRAVNEGLFVAPVDTLEAAMPLFERSNSDFLAVVRLSDEGAPDVLGVVLHVDALRVYNRALAATAAEEHS